MKIWLFFTFALILIVASAILVRDSLVYKVTDPMSENCQAVCLGVSSQIEGWYNTCTGNVIKTETCLGEKPRSLDFPGFSKESDLANLSNPATEYCREQKGKIENINKFGREYLVCKFVDQTECEAWSFLRGQCQVGEYQDFTNSEVVYEENFLGINITVPLLWLSSDPTYQLETIAGSDYSATVFYIDNEKLFTLVKIPKKSYNISDFSEWNELAKNNNYFYLFKTFTDDNKLKEKISNLKIN